MQFVNAKNTISTTTIIKRRATTSTGSFITEVISFFKQVTTTFFPIADF
ncbi:hypothetical protein [Chitinophaga sancti]|uniref:Uncharacterized protein n=1 Tax=Chitinophaga sancti TaxID=1004 RepID=A0ABZ0XHG0_9BACT|nr:hypothetical protein [Chitinophaga sancti]WQD64280.1 hypothetical protein U0033_07725 [Chitinophaga sancti]WQG90096.1 hypothetical protein SR876_01195 [Chitinophaga sancti]